jgi:hypothetical protein
MPYRTLSSKYLDIQIFAETIEAHESWTMEGNNLLPYLKSICFFGDNGVRMQDLMLARQALCHLSHALTSFWPLFIFSDRISFSLGRHATTLTCM